MKSRLSHLLLLLACVVLVSGCVTSRKTTTARTAVEMQLLAESAESTIAQFPDLSAFNGRSFYLDDAMIPVTDKEFIAASMRRYLLLNGLNEGAKDTADIIVTPRAANAAIDDYDIIIGIPQLSFSGGPLGIDFPEFALFKKDNQKGRNRMGLTAHNREGGEFAFDVPLAGAQERYTRYTLLLLITWNYSTLETPY